MNAIDRMTEKAKGMRMATIDRLIKKNAQEQQYELYFEEFTRHKLEPFRKMGWVKVKLMNDQTCNFYRGYFTAAGLAELKNIKETL